MKWLKIGALLVITLTIMRASSWALGWALIRAMGANARTAAVVANAAAWDQLRSPWERKV